MKKLYSLIKACMSSDMNIFVIKSKNKKGKSNIAMLVFITLCFMFAIWTYANMMLEKTAPLHFQFIVLSIFVFMTAMFTIIQGIYKSSALIFNCKDDQLLLSLPIKRSTVLFVRIFKFYVFELMFDTLFIVPLVIAYLRWADSFDWTFFLSSFVVLLMLPIIPIIISCIIGAISSSITSRFKYKNIVQTIISMAFLVLVLYFSYNLDGAFEYLAKHATSVNDLISKIYYPAGVYANLVTNFNVKDLLIFILINVLLFLLLIFALSKIYFKINSRLKSVTTTKKTNIKNLVTKSRSINNSLIRKELNTFLNTPVFIINAGFGLLLFVLASIVICFKYDSFIGIITDPTTFNVSKGLIESNKSLLVLALIAITSFMTSITSSVISLEGKNINILKSLPVSEKTILMSKVYSGLALTTPIFLIGDIILFIKFKITIIEILLLLVLSILIPLVSHMLGLLINLKYPKLDAENSTEVVKQSMSSFVSVMIGMILMLLSIFIMSNLFGKVSSMIILLVSILLFIIIDVILYILLIKIGVKQYKDLTV